MKNKFTYPLIIFFAWLGTSWHWLSGNSFIPWDSVDAFFPQVAFIVDTLLRGESPTWNPLIYGGLPVLGDPQGMIFTPHVLTGLVGGSTFGLWLFDATTLACMLTGSLCLYSYARSHGSTSPFAALGAIVFLLGGYGTSRLQHVPQIISYALLPVLLLTFRNIVLRPSLGSVLALSATGALLALNPNHVVFLIPFLLGPLLLLELLRNPKHLAPLFGLVASMVLVILLAIPSLSAILETVAHSTRVTITLKHNAPASLPGFSALSLFIPGLFIERPGVAGYWGPADLTESYLYIGVIPAVVAFAGIARRETPSTTLVATWIMGVLAFLFAMGTHGPIFPWLFDNAPGFSLFRRPSDGAYFLILYCALAIALVGAPGSGRLRSLPERLLLPAVTLLLLSLCFVGLVSYATQLGRIDSLLSAITDYAFRFAIAAGLSAAIWFLLPHKQRGIILLITIILLSSIDLASAGRWSIFASKYRDYGIASMYRILDAWQDDSSAEAASFRELAAAHSQKWRVEIVGPDNAPMALGIPMTQGYNPIKLRRYEEVFGAQLLSQAPKQFSALAPSIDSEAYRWLGLRFLLLHGYILDHPEKFGEIGQSALRLRNAALAAGGREIDTQGAYRLIEMHDFYPRAALISDGEELTGHPKRQCQIISETTTKGNYFCEASFSGKLIIGDSFAPGWMACVNGIITPVEPFMHALRSVSVPAGKSFVELRYQPVPFLRRFEKCTEHRSISSTKLE